MTIRESILRIYPLPEASLQLLMGLLEPVQLRKGHVLLHADKIEKEVYFIEKGIARAYAEREDSEVTFWFGQEGDIVISMRSYIDQQPGYESIELLEDCILYRVHSNTLQQLFETDIAMANWGRRFAEKELIKTEERLISRQFRTATERYQELLLQQPGLLQRVSLGHIASYLGITQVSLSRIRADIR